MKPEKENSCVGVSDLIGTILIIILVIGLAAVIAAFLMPGLLQKSVYIASEVRPIPIQQLSGIPVDVIGILPMAGDPFYIIWQPTAYKSGTPVSVRALGPDGVNHTWSKIDLKAGNLYGRQIYIYPPTDNPDPSKCDLCISDQPPGIMPPLLPMDTGKWTIQFVDENAHILVMSNTDGVIKGNSSNSRPWAGRWPGDLYDYSCKSIGIQKSNLDPIPLLGPGNMKYQSFNGSQNISYERNPILDFSGSMAISIWVNPTNLGSPTDTSKWNTIIGKGILVDPQTGKENDNYQLVAVGNQLYFEWTNANGNHYHMQTDSSALTQNSWQYITVNVPKGGIPQIYVNNIVQNATQYSGNNPNAGSSYITNVPVDLTKVDYPMNIGKQNSLDPNSMFYYKGDIGSLALYNRLLTPTEIQYNSQYYNA